MANKKEKVEDGQLSSIKKDFFFDMEDKSSPDPRKEKKISELLFSTDALSGYGLDLVFDLVKEAWFDGLDLAIRKNFDARKIDYVKKLSDKYELPVRVIQTSDNLNDKEINRALDLCYELGADTITINAPSFFNFKAFNFIADNILKRRQENKSIHFTIINPQDSSVFALPIPKYRFSNMVEIVKKYLCYIGLDISNLDSDMFETEFLRKMKDFLPYLSTIYVSDKMRTGEWHILPGEWVLKLEAFLKKVKEYGYNRYITTKIGIAKWDLADSDKVKVILKKARKYLQEHYEEVTLD
jgi:sugar phosphate isomerase/epimerase